MQKLDINLFPPELKSQYEKAKREYEKSYADCARKLSYADADRIYGESFPDFEKWSNDAQKLTSTGQQKLINKINEIVDYLNELEDKKVDLPSYMEEPKTP